MKSYETDITTNMLDPSTKIKILALIAENKEQESLLSAIAQCLVKSGSIRVVVYTENSSTITMCGFPTIESRDENIAKENS